MFIDDIFLIWTGSKTDKKKILKLVKYKTSMN